MRKLDTNSKVTHYLIRYSIIILGFVTVGMGSYYFAAPWWNSLLHAHVINELSAASASTNAEDKNEKLRLEAHDYNLKFLASGDNSNYMYMMGDTGAHIIGRIKIPKIKVDLPIYKMPPESADEVLRKGAGHMMETTLPVGGTATHAAITAHRGLASSMLFTDLDQVKVGDEFTIETLGRALVYRVDTVRIVDPDETDWLVVDPDRDLVTLITCDPLGINSHRMLVTGERIYPTPEYALKDLGKKSDQPGFPWWILGFIAGGGAVVAISFWATPNPKSQKAKKSD